MVGNLCRFTCRVLSGCCFLAGVAFSVYAQPLTFTTFAGPSGGPGSADGTGSAARLFHPRGVAIDGSGNVYVADTDNDTIRKITPAGVVTTLAGLAGESGSADGTGSAARFDSPRGVATDSAGNVYVADTDNDTIRKITPAGVVTTLAGSAHNFGSADGTGGAAGFAHPGGVAADSARNVYVADTFNNTIRKITPAGVVTTYWPVRRRIPPVTRMEPAAPRASTFPEEWRPTAPGTSMWPTATTIRSGRSPRLGW